MNYNLSTKNLEGFTTTNIYLGKPGENGRPVASLSMGNGTILNLNGTLNLYDMRTLVSIIRYGGAYVTVHTQQNPNGEIRGQIMPDKNTNHQ